MTKNVEAKPANAADQKLAPMAAKPESVEVKPAAVFPTAAAIAQPAIVKKPAVRAARAVKKAPVAALDKTSVKVVKPVASKAASKASVKTANAVAGKAPAKAAPKVAAATAPAKKQPVAKAAAEPKEKVKKPKLIRDSFTMPEIEYAVLGQVKKSCLKAGIEVKKSELLRAGVALIEGLDIDQLKIVMASLTPLKAGRPKKDK